ncbi:hypothetical protein ACHWQZ_G014522 [Mnemiopsis leidyi]
MLPCRFQLLTLGSQHKLYDKTVRHPMAMKFPLASAFVKTFIKSWINQVEDCEVLEEVYESFSAALTHIEPQIGYKIYTFDGGSHYHATKETVAMCSKGTTGLRTWQACLALCQWATDNNHIFKHKKVLELGCGVGLLGCVISHLCDKITLTDYHNSVLKAAQHTLDVNSVSNGNVSVLDWSRSCVEDDNLDIVVAADVVFDPTIVPDLVKTIKNKLSSSKDTDGSRVAYICSTVRNKDTYSTFLNEISEQGLTKTEIDSSKLKCIYLFGTDTIKLIKLQLKPPVD